jgi:hypothetical protein
VLPGPRRFLVGATRRGPSFGLFAFSAPSGTLTAAWLALAAARAHVQRVIST